MILQPIVNIAEICSSKRVRTIVLSPGSRSAHLSIAFVRHPKTQTYTISDERSAAFIALGMAQQQLASWIVDPDHTPFSMTALLCTSGTAGLNYSPAVAEAFYQQIPLIVFTADRPLEWTDQADGQTIRQRDLFGAHVKKSYQLPSDYQHPDAVWFLERSLNEAINLAQTAPYGPVHINIPIREPFYPEEGEEMEFQKVKIIQPFQAEKHLSAHQWAELMEIWEDSPKKLIVGGQQMYSPELVKILGLICQDYHIPIVGDLISNLGSLEHLIQRHDLFLSTQHQHTFEELRPDLLITFGKSLISKNLKSFLRTHKPSFHWHIEDSPLSVADTFQALTHHIATEPSYFFKKLFDDLDFANLLGTEQEDESGYDAYWQKRNQAAEKYLYQAEASSDYLTDWQAFQKIMEQMPSGVVVHLANSMAVRYANMIGFEKRQQDIQVFANRGTSGIDGSTSTALGAALASPASQVILITGDLAFFYDRNAFWNNYLPDNFKVILLNNHAGNIFRIIPGPREQPELDEYFETRQQSNAAFLAAEIQADYQIVKNLNELGKSLDHFYSQKKLQILEIETHAIESARVFGTLLKNNKAY